MKITKRQLRRIHESEADDEGLRGWQDFFAGEAPPPTASDWYLDGYEDAEKAHRDNPEKYSIAMRESPSITKSQLRRIIKEEKQRILNEGWAETNSRNAEEAPRASRSSGAHMSGRNQGVMEQLHTAIDALIEEMGSSEAQMELQGIVDEWVDGDINEGTSENNMPAAWKHILKGVLT